MEPIKAMCFSLVGGIFQMLLFAHFEEPFVGSLRSAQHAWEPVSQKSQQSAKSLAQTWSIGRSLFEFGSL